MKIACVAFMLTCAALIQGSAAVDDAAPRGSESVVKEKSGDRHVAQPHRSVTQAKLAVTSHVMPPSNNRTGSGPGNTALLRSIGPSTARNNVPHRGLNPVVIGGAAKSGARNTSAINGTHMNRRQH